MAPAALPHPFAGRRRLVAQPGGLMLGFAPLLVDECFAAWLSCCYCCSCYIHTLSFSPCVGQQDGCQLVGWVIITNGDGKLWVVSAFISADSQPKSVGLIWGLAATRRSVCSHQTNPVNSRDFWSWWQYHKRRPNRGCYCYYYYYYTDLSDGRVVVCGRREGKAASWGDRVGRVLRHR